MTRIYLIIVLLLYCFKEIYAQGGPPMNTDDPGTPDKGSWEINFSLNSDLKASEKELEAPLLDINYGYNERTQLKIEFPYFLAKTDDNQFRGRFGDVSLGVKYRFIEEEKTLVSFSIYPQVTLSTEENGLNEYLFPVQFEKNFGKVVLGADFGYAYLKDDLDFFENGILIGYEFSDKLEVMSELNFQVDRRTLKEFEGAINFGMRYEIGETFKFISSFGTGLISPDKDSRTKFMSFVGMQLNI